MKKTDIAIVGMSVYCPGANSKEEFWDNLVNGVDSITEMPKEIIDDSYYSNEEGSIDRFYCRRGGVIKPPEIDPQRYGILPIAAEGLDPEILVILAGVEDALADADVFEKKIPLQKGAIIVGKGNFTGLAELRSIDIMKTATQIIELVKNIFPDLPEEELNKIKKEYQAKQGRYQADTAIGIMPSLIASMAANKFDMKGPSYTVDGACASGLIAVDHCIQLLESGQCDIAVACGLHAGHSPMFWSIFEMMGAMSKKQQISPFSEDADGLLIGQAGAMVVLKTLDKAIADNDRIYAVIKGTAVCSDGAGSHVMVPTVQGQRRVLEMAWKKAGMDPKKIGYIEAHGTATPVGDKVEITTLTEFFGDNNNPNEALLGSVKSNIGHTMPAAGLLGLIKTALALYHRQIPPTLHCEKPMKSILQSRFRPAQELTPWDEDKYPLIAGVNAFGFGGINSHAILTAYGEKKSLKWAERMKADPVMMVYADSKEMLLKKIERGDFSTCKGDYRLVVFNPTQERIERAKSIINLDKPWRGRMDIWYSNKPLPAGHKVAFLFAGFDLGIEGEVDTLSDYFDIDRVEALQWKNQIYARSFNLFFYSRVIHSALLKTGVKPDLYAGHSIGEWYAAKSAGLIEDETVIRMVESLDLERQILDGIYYIATGAGLERVEPLYRDIPDIYLANDNCPNQVVLCGTTAAVEKLIELLKEEKIYYQIMPFQSGFHTPFISERMHLVDEACKRLEINQTNIPIWSATTLDVYPKDVEEYKQLAKDHLTKPVYFRSLIEKLYNEEKTRIFIQIGAGGLVGYVDDILKDSDHSAITTCQIRRNGLEQIRRVCALLFIEGKDVDRDFLGMNHIKQNPKNTIALPNSYVVVREFPALKKAIQKYNAPSVQFSPLKKQYAEATAHPVLQAFNSNIDSMSTHMVEMASLQNQMAELFEESGLLSVGSMPHKLNGAITLNGSTKINGSSVNGKAVNGRVTHEKPQKVNGSARPSTLKRTGQKFEERFVVTLEDHPYLMDHAVIGQPADWKYKEDLNPVIPMAMALELFAELGQKQDPSKKIIKLSGPASIWQWMNVEKPFIGKVACQWKTEETIALHLKDYVNMEVTLGDELPEPPEEYIGPIDLGKPIMLPITLEELYSGYAFHGPAYQSAVTFDSICEKGLRAEIRKTEGKGSMLDNFGQMVSLYMNMTMEESNVTFPVKVEELTFYQDMHDQAGLFEATLLIREVNKMHAIADIIVKRDEKIWCIAKGWHNQRFEFDVELWNVMLKPTQHLMAYEIAENVFYYDNAFNKVSSWQFLYRRYLNYPEKQRHDAMLLNRRKDYLISRIALKDAVRNFAKKKNGDYCYPIEIFIDYYENGKPYIHGLKEFEGVEISLAHKGSESVAIASNKPVGIDIEAMYTRGEDFIKHTFTDHEIRLMEDKEIVEWSTRFWVAKEAYSKMTGEGLKGNPKRFEVEKIEGEYLYIRGVPIRTMRHKEIYVIGYTN